MNLFKLKNFILSFLILSFASVAAQQLSFKVVNAESLKSIPQAQIKLSSQSDVLYSDAMGQFKFNYTKGDTLSIRKEGYHSLHIIPVDVNMGEGHVVTISMVPGSDAPATTPQSLQSFEYNFVHTSQPSNQLKAQVVESPDVTQKRTTTYFKIASMHLNNYKLESKQQKQFKTMDAAE